MDAVREGPPGSLAAPSARPSSDVVCISVAINPAPLNGAAEGGADPGVPTVKPGGPAPSKGDPKGGARPVLGGADPPGGSIGGPSRCCVGVNCAGNEERGKGGGEKMPPPDVTFCPGVVSTLDCAAAWKASSVDDERWCRCSSSCCCFWGWPWACPWAPRSPPDEPLLLLPAVAYRPFASGMVLAASLSAATGASWKACWAGGAVWALGVIV